MYLVARPKEQAQQLIQLLESSRIKAAHLPLMDIKPNLQVLNIVASKINKYDAILFISPASVNYMEILLPLTPKSVRFLAVGKATAAVLEKFGCENINFPIKSSGIAAFINEKILTEKNFPNYLAVIGGDEINPLLLKYIKDSGIKFDFLSIYNRANFGLDNLDLIRKNLGDRQLKGIIITSTIIANYLIECMKRLDLDTELKNCLIISIHEQITNFCKQYGFTNIRQTESADNMAVLTLLRKLEDE